MAIREEGQKIETANDIQASIQKLLDSDMTGYEIERRTNVPRSTIHHLRKRTRKVENLSWKSANKLYELSKSI